LAELSKTAAADVDNSIGEETMNEQGEVSLDEVSESENQDVDVTSEDTEASNS
jgi:DNA-directed RNA polymerase subunit omega